MSFQRDFSNQISRGNRGFNRFNNNQKRGNSNINRPKNKRWTDVKFFEVEYKPGSIVDVTTEDGESYIGKLIFSPREAATLIISPKSTDGKFNGHIIFRHSEITAVDLIEEIVPIVKDIPKLMLFDTFLVDSLEKLERTIYVLEDQTVVGVELVGNGKGRLMDPSWLVFCIKETIVLFDLILMNEDSFWRQMDKTIFGNEEVEKIVHDVRPLSDFLYHKHGIRISNVYDTMLSKVWSEATAGKKPPYTCLRYSQLLESNTQVGKLNSELNAEIKLIRQFEEANWDETNNPIMKRPPNATTKKFCCCVVKYLEILRSDFRKEAEHEMTALVNENIISIETESLCGALMNAALPAIRPRPRVLNLS